MAKRLSISQPVVIDTELTPLNDSFWIEANGVLQQWYYVSNGSISPNREETPLMLTPHISAVERTTGKTYNPSFYSVKWFVDDVEVLAQYNPSSSVQHEPYEIKDGIILVVRANNYSASQGIQIRCQATYSDPRDAGRLYGVGSSVVLTINVDASNKFPSISINAPMTSIYDPLSDDCSIFRFEASVDWEGIEPTQDYEFLWYGVDSGIERSITEYPCYVEGQGTKSLTLDAMYASNITIILKFKLHETDDNVIPKIVTRNLTWAIPPLKGIIQSNMGNMVNDVDRDFEFETIVYSNRGEVSEEKKKANLRFKWFKRKILKNSQPVSLGFSYKLSVNSSELRTTSGGINGSAMIVNDIYMLGEYKRVVDIHGNEITYNGKNVFGRV